MGKILCFLSEDFADFEITLACHKIRNVGKRDVLSMGYSNEGITSESGLFYLIRKLDQEGKMLAAICNGPQYHALKKK